MNASPTRRGRAEEGQQRALRYVLQGGVAVRKVLEGQDSHSAWHRVGTQ